MNLTERNEGGILILRPEGKLDALGSVAIEPRLRELAGQPGARIVLDLEATPYISSAGLRVILSLAKGLQKSGGQLRLASPAPAVWEIFTTAGFSSFLTTCANTAQAITELT